jgi:RHS repeat-associated protein
LASAQTYTACPLWGCSAALREGTTLSGTLPTDRQYTGQISEEQLGIYFYNARYYDGFLARFISPDTFIPNTGKPADWDRYAYASNSPIVYSDPGGHCYNRDSNGNLTARCQAYWEQYTSFIKHRYAYQESAAENVVNQFDQRITSSLGWNTCGFSAVASSVDDVLKWGKKMSSDDAKILKSDGIQPSKLVTFYQDEIVLKFIQDNQRKCMI